MASPLPNIKGYAPKKKRSDWRKKNCEWSNFSMQKKNWSELKNRLLYKPWATSWYRDLFLVNPSFGRLFVYFVVFKRYTLETWSDISRLDDKPILIFNCSVQHLQLLKSIFSNRAHLLGMCINRALQYERTHFKNVLKWLRSLRTFYHGNEVFHFQNIGRIVLALFDEASAKQHVVIGSHPICIANDDMKIGKWNGKRAFVRDWKVKMARVWHWQCGLWILN